MAKGVTSKKKKEDENRQAQQRQETRQRQQRTQGQSERRQEQPRNDQATSRQTTRREVTPQAIPVLETPTPRRNASGRNVAEMFPEYEPQQAPTIPVVEPIPTNNKGQGFQADLDQRMRDFYNNGTPIARHTAEREQRRTERAEEPQMEEYPSTVEKGRKEAQTSAEDRAKSASKDKDNLIETYGEREGGRQLSERAQNEVNKLQRRLDRVSQFDDVQNQNRARSLQNQIDAVLETENTYRDASIEKYLDPEYRMTNYEQKHAKDIVSEYLESNPTAKELYNSNNPNIAQMIRSQMSPEEQDEYERMISLDNKTRDMAAYTIGALSKAPFAKRGADKVDELMGVNDEYNFSNALENAQAQSPAATMGGQFSTVAAEYSALSPVLEQIPALTSFTNGLGTALFNGNAVAGGVAGSVIRGTIADAILDTVPNVVVPGIMEGKSTDQIIADAMNSLTENTAFNIGGEMIPYVVDGIKNIVGKIKSGNVGKAVDALKGSELNPLDMAKQNEIDVNAKVDNVNQAVDEVENLAKQVDEVTPKPQKIEAPKLNDEEQSLFDDLAMDYDGTLDGWKRMRDRALEYIYQTEDTAEIAARNELASRVFGEIERLDRESKEIINLGGTPTWTMPRPAQQLDGVASRINQTLDNVALEDETIAREADNIRKAIDDYKSALDGDSLDAINQARKDLYNACKRFDTRAKKIGLEGYDGLFGKKSFSYNTPQSMGVGSPQKLWQNIADAEENNRRLLAGEEPEDTLGKLLNGETLEETAKATPEVEAPKAEGPINPPDNNEPIDLTMKPSDEVKERGTSEHIRSIEDVRVATPMKMEGVSDEVVADFVDNPDMYKVLKNKDTKALADGIYNSGDEAIRIGNKVYTGDVETKFRTLLSEKNPSALPLGHQLAKDYSAAGNHEMAAQLYRDMGQALTESGQFSQAAAINMMRQDPLTALQYAEKQLDAINQQGAKRFRDRWKDLSLTEDEIKAFNSIEPGDAKAIKDLYDKIGARLGKEYPTTFMEKLLEGRKVAMLFNVRTNVRNVGANVPTLGMRWVADRVEAIGQNIAHLINPDFKVTQAVSGSGKEGRNLAKQVYESDAVQALLKGESGKYEIPELKNALMRDRQMFKGTALSKWINRVTDGGIEKLNKELFDKEGVESGLETIRNATYKALDLGDRPFVKENFIERLGSYIHAQGIKDIEDIPDEAIQTAWEEAMKATYKDNSWAVEMLRGLKGGMEKIPVIGKPLSQASIPFLQAPGNIAARMVDYSPIKASKGIADIISGAKNNSEKAVRQGIEEVSKGLTGTGMIILGMRLKEAGILTTDYSEDKDQKNFEKQNGFKPWALHVGDKYFSYDWAQPFAEPMIIGSLLQEAIDNSDQYDSDILNSLGIEGSTAGSIIGATKEGAKASINSWFNASPLQGMADLLKSDYSGDTDIAQNIFDTAVSDFTGAFIPSIVNATAKTIDPTQRNTYDPSNKLATFINQQQAKLPGLSAFLPAKYDTWGEEMTYADNSGESFLQRFLIPGDYGTESNDPIDIEINNLFDNTQDDGVFPLTAANKVGDRTLNNREVSAYQQDMGQRSRQLVEAFMDSDAYQNMSDIDKAATLKTLYGVSKAITERDMFDKPIADSSSYKKAVAAYDANRIEGVMSYLQGKDIVTSAGLSTSSNVAKDVQSLVESGNIEEAQALAEQASTLASYGLSTKAQTAYTERASQLIPGITPEVYAQTWDSFNVDGKGDISQTDMLDFFNQNGVTDEQQALTLWKAYLGTYNEGESKVPYLKEDGTWASRKPSESTSASNNNSDIMDMLSQQASEQATTNNNSASGDWLNQALSDRPQGNIPVVTGDNEPLTTEQALARIADTGIKTTAASSYWPQALAVNPNLTPEQFAQDWASIDLDHNGAHKKDEWVTALNNNNLDEAGDRRLIQMYYNTGWNPLNYANGKWSK